MKSIELTLNLNFLKFLLMNPKRNKQEMIYKLCVFFSCDAQNAERRKMGKGVENTGAIKWHPGFYGGMKLEMKSGDGCFTYEVERVLSDEPVRMDMLIIKKKENVAIDNPIAKFFRRHNVVEYKSPDDSLTIDDLYKTIGYACMYKGYGKTVNAIPAEELTVSIFRHTYPRKMFSELKKQNIDVIRRHPGIYCVKVMKRMPVQVVVIKELEPLEHSSLKILTKNADAVLQVSVSANREIYSRIAEEDNNMCEALRELFKDEIDVLVADGEARGVALGEARAMDAAVSRLADHYMSKNSELSREEAVRMASAILR